MRDEGLPYLRLDGVVLIPRGPLEEWMQARVASEERIDERVAEILDGFTKSE
jgi:hypothetical protein